MAFCWTNDPKRLGRWRFSSLLHLAVTTELELEVRHGKSTWFADQLQYHVAWLLIVIQNWNHLPSSTQLPYLYEYPYFKWKRLNGGYQIHVIQRSHASHTHNRASHWAVDNFDSSSRFTSYPLLYSSRRAAAIRGYGVLSTRWMAPPTAMALAASIETRMLLGYMLRRLLSCEETIRLLTQTRPRGERDRRTYAWSRHARRRHHATA